MILAIDIGNSRTSIGFFQRGKLLSEFQLETAISRTGDELWIFIQECTRQLRKIPEGIQGIVIASVVPASTSAFRTMSKKYLNLQPVIVRGDMDLGITVGYDDPKTVGADRLCGIVAAFTKYGGPAIVVDFGTATTFDAITKKGEYLGGAIAPGPGTAARSLHNSTAQLPSIEINIPDSVIATNTPEAIQAGVLFGTLEGAEGIIRRMRRIVGKHAVVIATGGYARMMAELSQEISYIEPTLVLDGARLIYERVNRTTPRKKPPDKSTLHFVIAGGYPPASLIHQFRLSPPGTNLPFGIKKIPRSEAWDWDNKPPKFSMKSEHPHRSLRILHNRSEVEPQQKSRDEKYEEYDYLRNGKLDWFGRA
jgi:type III pantothenate kinase